jgi:hypothetical protein
MIRSLPPTVILLILIQAAPAQAEEMTAAVSSGSQFNPLISLILDGNLYHDNQRGRGGELMEDMAGISHGVATGPAEAGLQNGFNLGESELVMSAIVDPYFDGQVTLAVGAEGDVGLEESWLQTRRLPAGLKVKMGKFLSGIGYQNSKHKHAWDFADQNLAYSGLLGGEGLKDSGLQLTWIAPTPLYLQLGLEALQGNDQEKFGHQVGNDDAAAFMATATPFPDTRNGPRLTTAFIKVAPDLGEVHALQVGLSWARAGQHQLLIDPDQAALSGDEYALDGRQQLLGLDAVYKRDSAGEYGAGDFTLTGEYLRVRNTLTVAAAAAGSPLTAGAAVSGTQSGYYLQAAYGLAPRWELAVRHDVNGQTNALHSGGLSTDLPSSQRNALSLSFMPSEFSRLRLQAAQGDIVDQSGASSRLKQFFLQYTHSLGPHGAHKF